jgi:hypothetical protein
VQEVCLAAPPLFLGNGSRLIGVVCAAACSPVEAPTSIMFAALRARHESCPALANWRSSGQIAVDRSFCPLCAPKPEDSL